MSEIQPSLGELEDAQNTAYENFFTARDAVTAAGERVAAADEAVCLAEKKYMNGEISVEEWEATLQELSDAQVAETAANENYEAAAAGAQAAAEAVEAKKQELRDSRVNDTAYVVHCARIECPFGMRESYLALDATHGVLTHQIPQMTVKDMILNTNIINFGGCHSRENPDVQAEIEKTNAIIESKKDWRDDVVGYFTKKWNERVTIIKAGIGLALLLQLRLSVWGAVALAVLFLTQLGLAFFYQATPAREIAVLTTMAWIYLGLAMLLLARNFRQVPALVGAAWKK